MKGEYSDQGEERYRRGADIGTSKVVCFVARIDGSGLRVIGIGQHHHRPARRQHRRHEAATRAISSAVSAAEEMCGETIREEIVGVGGGQPASHNQTLEVQVGHHEIGERDVRRLLSQIHLPAETADRDLIHTLPIGYTVDGSAVVEPRGMYGERLGGQAHLVTAATGAMRNLAICIKRAHLDVADRVVSAYASGLASLVADERNLGATLIDMGGGTTSIAVFYDGHLVHVDSIPIGGMHVTSDIARGLSTPIADAERMKTLIGRARAKPNDEYDIIDVPLIGEQERTTPNHVPRSILVASSVRASRRPSSWCAAGSRPAASTAWPADAPCWSAAPASSTGWPTSRATSSRRRCASAVRSGSPVSPSRPAVRPMPPAPAC